MTIEENVDEFYGYGQNQVYDVVSTPATALVVFSHGSCSFFCAHKVTVV